MGEVYLYRWEKSTSKAILQGILDAVTLPGDVYRGEVDPRSDEAIGRAFDLAGTLTLGAGAVPSAANELRMGIKAYHGSPHSFDKFSSERIGTGEGAQAYGHGLYFAENEAVAKDYAKNLARRHAGPSLTDDFDKLMIGGKPLRQQYDIDTMPEFIEMAGNGDVQGVRVLVGDRLVRWQELAADPTYQFHDYAVDKVRAYDALSKELDAGAQITNKLPPKGATYEVDIAADPSDFLDWDKPLSEQPAQVKDALKRAGLTTVMQDAIDKEFTTLKDFEAATGEDLVAALRDQAIDWQPGNKAVSLAQERAAATETLRQAGIPGIRYLDQGSRKAATVTAADGSELPHNIAVELRDIYGGDWRAFKEAYKDTKSVSLKAAIDDIDARGGVTYQAKGTSNYVVFDDSLISILKKYGVVGPVLAALGLSQAMPDQAEASEREGGGW